MFFGDPEFYNIYKKNKRAALSWFIKIFHFYEKVIKDNKSKNPLDEAQKRELKNLITKGLTRAEQLIIILYYYEEMTMKEIGATLDLSESRVSQMHSSIIARLKAQMNSRKKEFAI